MRITTLIVFVLTGIISCRPVDRNEPTIVFTTRSVQSPSLLVIPVLECLPGKPEMKLDLRLKNLTPEKIKITDVTLMSPKGLKTSTKNIADKTLYVPADKDTTLLLTFTPINNKSLFQATGLPGLTDSTYHLSVYYSLAGKQDIRVIHLVSQMPKESYLHYQKLYDNPVQVYCFNTTNGFNEKQQQFLKTTTSTSPFVNITQQELAVSGLNFRIKCFHRKDSLFTELFIVNHSDMTIRMDTSTMNMLIDGNVYELSGTGLSTEKVTGSKAESDILRKGDRCIIKVQKHIVNAPKTLTLAFSESFHLPNNKPLFSDDLELIRSSGEFASD